MLQSQNQYSQGTEVFDASLVPLVSIAIPTYGRDNVLTDTLKSLLGLGFPAQEILVLDQTRCHDPTTASLLKQWHDAGKIRWLALPEPSITSAMNRGLLEARNDIVLFLDDDIVPFIDLVSAHAEAHAAGADLVAGRVLQPWDGEIIAADWSERRFASTECCKVSEFMGGNFSISRVRAIELGGFDENFVRVAYQFEREFSDRWRRAGGDISFDPRAAIHHLKAKSGGTRSFGEHLKTILPAHSVGAYYYFLCSPLSVSNCSDFLARPFKAIVTRHHLNRPWWIPLTLISEIAGILWALKLYIGGPRYCKGSSPT